MKQCHAIGLAMLAYANDHGGTCPDGQSSTEAFQKLMDGGYITDPKVFYMSLSGKIEPVAGRKLRPENVCWDITAGVDSKAPDWLPLVFMTKYKASYTPGGAAVPLVKPYPLYSVEIPNRTWFDWLNGRHTIYWTDSGGIAIYFKNGCCWFKPLEKTPSGDWSIPNFIPPDFKPDGKTYRQLTPDGPLPP